MKSTRLLTLESIRFLAALSILQYHLWQNYLDVNLSDLGTDFFLILVGVVAAYTQAKMISKVSWWGYISGRYRRLYVTFIPLFIITLLAKRAEMDIDWAWKSFLFIPMPGRLPVIGATWMISMFLLFYFVFSLCFLVKSEKILWLVFGIWAACIAIYNLLGMGTGLPKHWANLLFNERNLEFIFGYGVGIVLRNVWLESRQAGLILGAGLLGVLAGIIALFSGYNTGRAFFVGIPGALFVLGLAMLEIQKPDLRLIRWLSTPWLVWLGGTAYILYLSHGIFLQAWSRVLPVSYGWVLPITVGATAVAALLYLFWEFPILTYLKTGARKLPRLPVNHFQMSPKTHRLGK